MVDITNRRIKEALCIDIRLRRNYNMRDSAVSELVKTAYNCIAASYEEAYSEIDASDRIYWGYFRYCLSG